jgi:hypothetical protein
MKKPFIPSRFFTACWLTQEKITLFNGTRSERNQSNLGDLCRKSSPCKVHYIVNSFLLSYLLECITKSITLKLKLNSQNCRIYFNFSSSSVLGSRNTTFRKLDPFPSSGEEGEKTPTQLNPLESANLNRWTHRK